jgi:hypothetical protein
MLRRSVFRFDNDPIENTLKSLSSKYPFFSQVNIIKTQDVDQVPSIQILSTIDDISKEKMKNAIEALIRQVSYEVYDSIGLYFINEFVEYTGSSIKDVIIELGIDLFELQLEIHNAYLLEKRKSMITEKSNDKNRDEIDSNNLLGYSWKDISYWKLEEDSTYCNLYDKNNTVIDRINLDRVIRNYIEVLSGERILDPDDLEKTIHIYEQEYTLLKLMLDRDMDAETAMSMLQISKDDLNQLVQKLHQMNMIQYISENTVKLTDKAIDYVSADEKKA